MGLVYFKRYRMELDFSDLPLPTPPLPVGYALEPWSDGLCRDHATAKFSSFQNEMDANVFPCLGRHDGCLHLMREITKRRSFVPEATWLIRYQAQGKRLPIATIQGLRLEGWGAVQNLGVHPEHRGRGLGAILLAEAAEGFRRAGLSRMHLEVTTDNNGAVRLYRRLGLRQANTLYKAAEVSGV